MYTYDIFIENKYFGNVAARNLAEAEMRGRQLIKMSNPKVSANKFSVLLRTASVEFDL